MIDRTFKSIINALVKHIIATSKENINIAADEIADVVHAMQIICKRYGIDGKNVKKKVEER